MTPADRIFRYVIRIAGPAMRPFSGHDEGNGTGVTLRPHQFAGLFKRFDPAGQLGRPDGYSCRGPLPPHAGKTFIHVSQN